MALNRRGTIVHLTSIWHQEELRVCDISKKVENDYPNRRACRTCRTPLYRVGTNFPHPRALKEVAHRTVSGSLPPGSPSPQNITLYDSEGPIQSGQDCHLGFEFSRSWGARQENARKLANGRAISIVGGPAIGGAASAEALLGGCHREKGPA